MSGNPSYPIPAAVQVVGLGPISDALVGRIRWDNPLVLIDAAEVLRSTRAARQRFKHQPLNQFYQ